MLVKSQTLSVFTLRNNGEFVPTPEAELRRVHAVYPSLYSSIALNRDEAEEFSRR
jgi:hypothetical protein